MGVRYIRCTGMFSALEIFLVMRYINLLFTYLLTLHLTLNAVFHLCHYGMMYFHAKLVQLIVSLCD